MQTSEYRGFAGQFSDWAHRYVLAWRWPLLISLLLHALVFWPAALQQGSLESSAGSHVRELRAHLQPPVPVVIPILKPVERVVTRHVNVTQPSSNRPASNETAPASGVESQAVVLQASPGLDAAAVRGYRISLARVLAEGALRAALTPDMRGTLEVGISITHMGLPKQVAVVRSSGQPALDRQVLSAVRSAVNTVTLPAAMQGRDFVVLLPIEVGESLSPVAGQ